MTPQAFSVFSTDSEHLDRPVHENNFYFSENATWFAKKNQKFQKNLKKNLEKNKIFGFLEITFFWKTFLKNPDPVFRAGRFYVDCRALQHSRRSGSPLPKFFRPIFFQKSSFFRISPIFLIPCSMVFRDVPSCSAMWFFVFSSL